MEIDKASKMAETFLGKESTKESTLFVFSFFIWLFSKYNPYILVPIRESIKLVISYPNVAPWIRVAENLVIFWNLVSVMLSILVLIWTFFIPLYRKNRDDVESNWVKSLNLSLWWLLRSSLWWWNLRAVQILLSLPVYVPHFFKNPYIDTLFTCALVDSYPAYMFLMTYAWLRGK